MLGRKHVWMFCFEKCILTPLSFSFIALLSGNCAKQHCSRWQISAIPAPCQVSILGFNGFFVSVWTFWFDFNSWTWLKTYTFLFLLQTLLAKIQVVWLLVQWWRGSAEKLSSPGNYLLLRWIWQWGRGRGWLGGRGRCWERMHQTPKLFHQLQLNADTIFNGMLVLLQKNLLNLKQYSCQDYWFHREEFYSCNALWLQPAIQNISHLNNKIQFTNYSTNYFSKLKLPN